MKPHIIGAAAEFPVGSRRVIDIGGRSIGVFNIEGKLYALRNYCPHQGAELCSGLITPLVTSEEPGQFSSEREGEIIRCPWHQWEFDIKTGCLITDPRVKTRSYDVVVETYNIEQSKENVVVYMPTV
ncbi:2Fe-2S ferredoxin [Paenibacillus swuensis]|uniref:2Fe-2S ferredoxin n=1 Tax=Paenibacillus swuensis TaxID=1178515 RepID=A0A172TN90_9BACL|nr:Rieske (2Fe-2S) protein [Paenibacillus swuensis]ANE48521.1 2Fe-2S ferredoxin [Paenibacillus swuensis]